MLSTRATQWLLGLLFVFGGASHALAQSPWICRTGRIHFSASTPLEKIEATNNNVLAQLNPQSGKLEVVVLLKSFQFPLALMQDHFNDNYVESDQFPKSTFSGQLLDWPSNGLEQDHWEGQALGSLSLHGITRVVKIPVRLNKQKNSWSGQASFVLSPADHEIHIPALVRDKIAKEVKLDIQLIFPLPK